MDSIFGYPYGFPVYVPIDCYPRICVLIECYPKFSYPKWDLWILKLWSVENQYSMRYPLIKLRIAINYIEMSINQIWIYLKIISDIHNYVVVSQTEILDIQNEVQISKIESSRNIQ